MLFFSQKLSLISVLKNKLFDESPFKTPDLTLTPTLLPNLFCPSQSPLFPLQSGQAEKKGSLSPCH